MKKKLALEELKLSSFVTTEKQSADLRVGGVDPQNTADYTQCNLSVWCSELYTACACPETWHCSNNPLNCE